MPVRGRTDGTTHARGTKLANKVGRIGRGHQVVYFCGHVKVPG